MDAVFETVTVRPVVQGDVEVFLHLRVGGRAAEGGIDDRTQNGLRILAIVAAFAFTHEAGGAEALFFHLGVFDEANRAIDAGADEIDGGAMTNEILSGDADESGKDRDGFEIRRFLQCGVVKIEVAFANSFHGRLVEVSRGKFSYLCAHFIDYGVNRFVFGQFTECFWGIVRLALIGVERAVGPAEGEGFAFLQFHFGGKVLHLSDLWAHANLTDLAHRFERLISVAGARAGVKFDFVDIGWCRIERIGLGKGGRVELDIVDTADLRFES